MEKSIFESSFKYADELPSFEWNFDISKQYFQCDNQINSVLGLPKNQNMTLAQLLQKIDVRQIDKVKQALNKAFQEKKPFIKRVILTGNEDRYLADFEIVSSDERSISGKVSFILLFPSEKQETELLRSLFSNGSRGYLLAASDHTILMVNETFCTASGYSEGELIGQHASILKSGKYSKEFYTELWRKVDKNKLWVGELFTQSKTNEIYTHEVSLERIDLLDHSHFYFSSTRKKELATTHLISAEQEDKFVSSVQNKTNYIAELTKAYDELSAGNTIVVATFSIKMFQDIGATNVNWLVSQRFNMLPNKGAIGALNSREFSIFWVESKGVDKVNQMLLKTLSVLTGERIEDDFSLVSVVNMGISILDIDAKSPDQLLKNSMQTLNVNPILNKSEVFYFDARLTKRFDNRKTLASLLKKALELGNITVLYQPIVSIPLMRTVGFEALVRFDLNTTIEYNTQTLIEIAEEYNWIDQLDHLVTDIALLDLVTIQKECGRSDLAMSINRSLMNDKVAKCSLEETIAIIESCKVNFGNITIELIESAQFASIDKQKLWVEKLQKMGVKIAIDDFGNGFSSFDYLDSFPVDYIKIARNFITGLMPNSRKYAMIEAMTQLAHKIGAKVVAEGVETEAELLLLSQIHVDEVQGYLFSKPQDLTELLKDKNLPFPKHLKPLLINEVTSTVRKITQSTFSTIDMDDRLSKAQEKIKLENCDYLVVLENNHYQGILFSADVDAALSPYLYSKAVQKRDTLTLEKRVHQVMKKNLQALHIDSPMVKAEHIFLAFPKAVIILFETEGKCVGVTTIDKLLRYSLKNKSVQPHEIEFEI